MSRVNYKRGKLSSGAGYGTSSGKSTGTTRKNAQYAAARRPAPRVQAKRAAGENGVWDLAPRCLVACDTSIIPTNANANTGAVFASNLVEANPPYCAILNHGIAQGQGQSERDRRHIEMKAISLKMCVRPGAAPTSNEVYRWKIWLVYFKEQKTTLVPTGSHIVANPFNAAPNDVPNPLSMPQLTNAKEYQVIKTWTGHCDSDSQQATELLIDAYVNLNNRVTSWNRADTAGDYSAMEGGALGLYFGAGLSNGSIVNGSGPQFVAGLKDTAPILSYSSRIYFNP